MAAIMLLAIDPTWSWTFLGLLGIPLLVALTAHGHRGLVSRSVFAPASAKKYAESAASCCRPVDHFSAGAGRTRPE
jgi:hypothetical protein